MANRKSKTRKPVPVKPVAAKQQASDDRLPRWQFWFGVFQGFLALAQIAIGYWQITTSQSQSQLDKRPWLSIGTPELEQLSLGEIPKFKFCVTNEGESPAKIIGGKSGIFIEKAGANIQDDLSMFNHWADQKERGLLLSPAGLFEFNMRHGPEMSPKLIEHIKSGIDTLYIGVRFAYLDNDGNEHLSQRCFYYHPEANQMATQSLYDAMD